MGQEGYVFPASSRRGRQAGALGRRRRNQAWRIWPERSVSIMASSSTSAPRAVFTKMTPGFMTMAYVRVRQARQHFDCEGLAKFASLIAARAGEATKPNEYDVVGGGALGWAVAPLPRVNCWVTTA